jgi:hypothetical protein
MGEVLQVNAFRQRFRGANARHALEPQGHDGMDCTQNEQRVRRRNVYQKPAMKKVVQAALAL